MNVAEIKIPLLGIETVANIDSVDDIIQAVTEASVAFCIAAEEHGQGIKKELKLVNNKSE